MFRCVVKIVKRSALKIGEAQRKTVCRCSLLLLLLLFWLLLSLSLLLYLPLLRVEITEKTLHAQTPDNERLTCEPVTDCHIGRLPL